MRGGHDPHAGDLPYEASHDRCDRRRDADHRPGLPGTGGLLGRGRAPLRPDGPLSFRLGNRLVGNPASAAGLEITVQGPALQFNAAAVVALTGAHLPATLDDEPVPYWRAVPVRRGQTLRIGSAEGAGLRAYLAVRGGLDVPDYLGSKATSRSAGLAATPAGPCGPATCCACGGAQPPRRSRGRRPSCPRR